MEQYEKKEVLLSANGVGLAFKQNNCPDKVIFKDINFQIHDVVRPGQIQGQVFALVGKSGIGKTQMIRLLAGLPIHKSRVVGKILVNVAQTPVCPGDVGVVSQSYYLPAHLTLKKMLMLAANQNKAFKGDRKIILDAMTSYVLDFELGEHINKYPIQLSGGQKQRAAIACQLLYGSNFLIMDEPFSGLDIFAIDKTLELILKVSKQSETKTVMIVSHDLVNCCAISDTILILSNKGRSPADGATIVKEVDLMSLGLAWHIDIKSMSQFTEVIKDVKLSM